MEQFNLDTWLKDKSRKVVTRRGNPVRIICWDREHGEDDLPIVCLEKSNGGEFLLTCKSNGRDGIFDTPYDLFFADEEEKLTEFEKCVQNILNEPHFQDIEAVKQFSKTLLDLAKKEIRKEQQEKLRTLEMPIDITEPYYIKGKEDALKYLPKWKKAKENRCLPYYVAKIDKNGDVIHSHIVYEGEYFIMLQSLKILPKEE